MNGRILALAIPVLLHSWSALAQTAAPNTTTTIRDIREPLPPSGVPPFTGTVVVLLVSGLVAAIAKRKKIVRRTDDSTQPFLPVKDDLDALNDAFARGELSSYLLFQQLESIARSRLMKGDCSSMTGTEFLEAVEETVPAEMFTVASILFALSDRVRFGAYQPDTVEMDEAIATVRLLMRHEPEVVT